MNSRRVRSSIAELQKGINDCELLVTKVVNGKVDRSKSNLLKCDTSKRECSVMTHVTAPRERNSPSPPCKLNSQKPINRNRLLCKEVFENSNANVEVTVKAKTSSIDKSRKRLESNAFLSSAEADGISKSDQKKQSTNAPAPPKVNRKGHSVKKVLSSKNKHLGLSWDHILKDGKAPCSIHDSKAKKFTHNSKSLHKALYAGSLNNSFSSDHRPVHYRSRSVQCYLLKNNAYGAVKNEENPQKTTKSSEIGLNAASDGGGIFSVYNPVRTLHFLIKELDSRIKNHDNDENLQRIITDMEQTLTRLSPELSNQEFKENIDIPVRDTSKHINLGFVPIKPTEPTQSRDILIQEPKYPEKTLTVSSSTPSQPIPLQIRDENYSLVGLETKCVRLESNLNQLKENYEKQRKENESVIEQMKHLEEQLKSANSQEKEYLTTIGYLKSNLQTMRQRIEEQAKSISELSTNNKKLKEENKALSRLHERESVLVKHLKESTEKEGKIHAELQIMKLEQEKFHILLAGKNSEVQKLKQELRDIQSFVSKQLSNLKSHVFNHKNKKNILDESFGPGKQSSPTLEDSDIESVAFFEKAGRGNDKPVCSSPTSSIPSSSGINSSWQKISRISSSSEKDLKKSSPEVLTLSPPKARKMKTSDDEIEIAENTKSFPLIKSDSVDFRSFLLESLSETAVQVSNVTEPKSCQELKDELRDCFDKIKREANKDLGISLPSPPRHFSEMSEPGGMSQWSEVSDVESCPFLSVSNIGQKS